MAIQAKKKAPVVRGALQGSCSRCRKKRRPILQRQVTGLSPGTAPPVVPEAHRLPSAQLDAEELACAKPCSGHDLSRIAIRSRPPARIQANLQVNTPGDIYEEEADRIADQVMAAPSHPAFSPAPPDIQRFVGAPGGQMNKAAPASVDRTLAGPGKPLEPALRQDMEQRFGHDFSQVRVHSSDEAEQSAREVNANAYTVGHNIVFDAGRYAPGTDEGRRLIAHELTHVLQQSGLKIYNPARHSAQRTSSQQGTSGKMVARQIVFGRTNYRFDTYQITEADLRDPDIVSRLKALPFSALIKYRDRVADPAVKDYINNLLLTTPPTSLEIASGIPLGEQPITMKIKTGWTIKILADAYTEDETLVPLDKAKTFLRPPKKLVRWTLRSGKIENIRLDKTLVIQTVYGRGTGRTSPAGYGRGTTEEDKKGMMTTLAHHEGFHALDLIDFLMNNPPPTFGGREGMDISRAEEEGRKYRAALNDHIQKALEFSSKKTDCVGAESGLAICKENP